MWPIYTVLDIDIQVHTYICILKIHISVYLERERDRQVQYVGACVLESLGTLMTNRSTLTLEPGPDAGGISHVPSLCLSPPSHACIFLSAPKGRVNQTRQQPSIPNGARKHTS